MTFKTPCLLSDLSVLDESQIPILPGFIMPEAFGCASGLGAVLPFILPFGRPCILAHSVRPSVPLTAFASKFGGVFLANGVETWPKCGKDDSAYVGLIQLLKDDFPVMPFPPGTDAFQLLYCPHEEFTEDSIEVRWVSREETVCESNPEFRQPESDERIPRECQILPEEYMDYPGFHLLPPSVQEKIICDPMLNRRALLSKDPEEPADRYNSLAVVEGSYVGGYAHWWITDDETPTCECGSEKKFLFRIESDFPRSKRWTPLDELGLPIEFKGHGIIFSRDYGLNVFVCLRCSECPISIRIS